MFFSMQEYIHSHFQNNEDAEQWQRWFHHHDRHPSGYDRNVHQDNTFIWLIHEFAYCKFLILFLAQVILDEGYPVADEQADDRPAHAIRKILPQGFYDRDQHLQKYQMSGPGVFREKIAAITVGDAMTKNPVSVRPDTDIGVIAELMVDKNYHSLPVIDGEKLVGIIGKEDILQTLIKK